MTMRGVVAVFCVSGFLAVSSSLSAQSDWTLLPLSGTAPSARAYAISSFDLTRGVWVLFGGQVGAGVSPQETWEFDGNTWTNKTSFPAPDQGVMAYDPVRGKHVLFEWSLSNPEETWEWDGIRWLNVTPAMSPSRQAFSLAYDPTNAGVVFYGGTTRETWLWNGSTWVRLNPTTTPPKIESHVMVTDWRRSRVVMYTGYMVPVTGAVETWIWDGRDWSRVANANDPSHRRGAGAAYDWVRDRVVLFGGRDQNSCRNDTWEFAGVRWDRLVTASAPAARAGMAMTYDPMRRRVFGFGGVCLDTHGRVFDNQLWKLETASPASYDPRGPGCVGTAGTPTLSAPFGSLPWIDDGFDVDLRNAPTGAAAFMATGFSASSWAGIPLPLDLGPFGAPGCPLRLAPFVWGPFAPGPSGVSRWRLPIPNNARLAGLTFFNQALVLDPGANALGAVVSDAMQGRVGIR